MKANQSKISFGDGGGPSQLSALLFMAHTGTRMTLVPYKGTGPAMTDLLAKHIDFLSNSSSMVGPYIKAGKVKLAPAEQATPGALQALVKVRGREVGRAVEEGGRKTTMSANKSSRPRGLTPSSWAATAKFAETR